MWLGLKEPPQEIEALGISNGRKLILAILGLKGVVFSEPHEGWRAGSRLELAKPRQKQESKKAGRGSVCVSIHCVPGMMGRKGQRMHLGVDT